MKAGITGAIVGGLLPTAVYYAMGQEPFSLDGLYLASSASTAYILGAVCYALFGDDKDNREKSSGLEEVVQ